MTETTTAPDVDRRIQYRDVNGGRGVCRMRAWESECLVVVTEVEDNPAMSVTNASEAIAHEVEAVLHVQVADAEWAAAVASPRWQMAEHYPASSWRGPTVDFVRYTGRVAGMPTGPAWSHVSETEMAWLYEALA